MSTDKMRESFELTFAIDWAEEDDTCKCWELAWKASREALEQPQISPEVQAMLKQFEADEAEEIQRADSFVRKTGRASISALQRNFKISYGNACRLMDKLVARGVVSPIDAEGRRTVLPEQVQP